MPADHHAPAKPAADGAGSMKSSSRCRRSTRADEETRKKQMERLKARNGTRSFGPPLAEGASGPALCCSSTATRTGVTEVLRADNGGDLRFAAHRRVAAAGARPVQRAPSI